MKKQQSRRRKHHRHISISNYMPNNYDFNFCPVNQKTQYQFQLDNQNPYPCKYHFDQCKFVFDPQKGTIGPNCLQNITISYTAKTATVHIAKTILYAEKEDPKVIKLSAIGKYPFINIQHKKYNFESVLIGRVQNKDVIIKNLSQVPTHFQITKIDTDHFRDHSFTLNQMSGDIPAKSSYLVKVEYKPAVPKLFSCSHYKIECVGGNSVEFECQGIAQGYSVNLTNQSLNFGAIKIGNSQKRVFHVQNNSRIPTTFQFFTDKKNIFSFSKSIGKVNAKSEFRIVVKFTPRETMNYYERVYCISRNHNLMYIDLIGNGYDLLIKPLQLTQRHIDIFRRKVIDGTWDMIIKKPKKSEIFQSKVKKMKQVMERLTMQYQEHQMSDSHNDQVDGFGGQSKPQISLLQQDLIVEEEMLNQLTLHKELMITNVADSKLVGISTNMLDFDFTEALTVSPAQEIEVRNQTNKILTCFWQLTKDTYSPDGISSLSIFTVSPKSASIKPQQSCNFTVTFRPTKNYSYYFQYIQFFCIEYNKKLNRKLLQEAKRKQQSLTRIKNLNISSIRPRSTQSSMNQSFLRDITITPPLQGFIRCVGHSFIGDSQPFIPNIEAIPNNKVYFAPCSLNESKFQTIQFENKTDTPTYFRFSPMISKSFRVYPECGLIQGNQFGIILFEFNPQDLKQYHQQISCCFNHNPSNQIHIHLYAHSFQPLLKLQNKGRVYFPPSYTGVISKQYFSIQNSSRIPLIYEIEIPKKFEEEVYLEPKAATLKPNENARLMCSFIPYKKRSYHIKIPIEAYSVCDETQNLIGFHLPGSGKGGQQIKYPREKISNMYQIEMFGAGGDGSLSLSPKTLNFKIVKVNFTKKQTLTLHNHSNCTFFIQLNLYFEGHKKFDQKHQNIINKSFELDFTSGMVAGNSKIDIGISFMPVEICNFNLVFECVAKEKNPMGIQSTKKVLLQKCFMHITAQGSYPQLKFVDVRNDAISVSTLWENFSINSINKELLNDLSENERKFNKIETLSFTEAQNLQKQLKSFDWDFGHLPPTTPVQPRRVIITVRNIGGTDLNWSFKLPSDDQVEMEPWADPGEPSPEEAKERDIIDKQIFNISPQRGILSPQELADIVVTYKPIFNLQDDEDDEIQVEQLSNKHELRVVLQIANGKPIQVFLKGMTLAPFQGRVIFKKKIYHLPPVPLGSKIPVQFPIELQNVGSAKVTYEINTDEITCDQHSKEIGSLHKILNVVNPKDVVDQQMTHFIYCDFNPFEAKLYTFNVKINVYDFEKEAQPPINLVIEGQGYANKPPKVSAKAKEGEIPSQRSQVSKLGSTVFFSIEEVDFGCLEANTTEHRIIILYNSNPNQRLLYRFNQKTPLICNDKLELDPQQGELIPNDFVEIKLSLTSHVYPSVYEGEIKCQILRDKREYDEDQLNRERGLDDEQTITKTQEINKEIHLAKSQMDQDSKYEKETLFLRIKKKSKLQVMYVSSDLNTEPHVFEEFKEDSRHFLEILTSQAIFDIMNEPDVEKCIQGIQKQDIQVYGNLSNDPTISLANVTKGYREPDLTKEIMQYADETRLFFNNDFTSTIDNILENTFFNLIQEATHEELDLCQVRKKYVNISQDK